MNVAVMGAGGVGGYLGGMLARAGNQVTLIARGEHLNAIRSRGLQLRTQQGEFTVKVNATDAPASVGPAELALFTVKTYHNQQAMQDMAPLVGKETTILTLQNGVTSYDQLSQKFGPDRVLPGAIYIETRVESPGVIRQQGNVVRVVLGEVDGRETPRVRRIADTLAQAGVKAEVAQDIMKVLWTKFVFIVTLAGVTSLARANMDQLLSFPESRQVVLDVLKEAVAVGRAKGVKLDEDIIERTMEYMRKEAKALRASMHNDLERGRPLELDSLNGTVVRLAAELGVPVPTNRLIYSLLHVHDVNARRQHARPV